MSNRKKLDTLLDTFRANNADIGSYMQDRMTKMVALAMLYLGEGTKWQKSRAPKLTSTSPMIIQTYIRLLRDCYGITTDKLRARVQLRADQDMDESVKFWSNITGIEEGRFYQSYVDKRTVGKTTIKPDYQGVCTISCAGTHIQLELAEIAGIIYKSLKA